MSKNFFSFTFKFPWKFEVKFSLIKKNSKVQAIVVFKISIFRDKFVLYRYFIQNSSNNDITNLNFIKKIFFFFFLSAYFYLIYNFFRPYQSRFSEKLNENFNEKCKKIIPTEKLLNEKKNLQKIERFFCDLENMSVNFSLNFKFLFALMEISVKLILRRNLNW